jgi:hypothetical protein
MNCTIPPGFAQFEEAMVAYSGINLNFKSMCKPSCELAFIQHPMKPVPVPFVRVPACLNRLHVNLVSTQTSEKAGNPSSGSSATY